MIAPDIDPKRRHPRFALRAALLVTGSYAGAVGCAGITFRSVAGGFLVQERDRAVIDRAGLRVVTRRQPAESESLDLLFADRVVKHVKSNAIVFARDGATVGIGAGQMSRVDSVRIAAEKAAEIGRAAGSGYVTHPGRGCRLRRIFPICRWPRGCDRAGATAIIQPGGSVRDPE